MTAKPLFTSISDDIVVNKIYEIRNQKVMLDRDLAELYGVETRVLNQAVKRNINRFPEDFMFQLNSKELENWKSQIVISNREKLGLRKPPFAFTEHGVLMLSSVLNSPQAIQVNIQIVRIFSRLRKLLDHHNELKLEIAEIKRHLHNHDKNIELVFTYLDQLIQEKAAPRKRIGFKPDEL
ncbi:ORF6N domain-containing protein [Pedobacter nanyangensis]|uniref:ORF6N domain-containing protein n=1 Tax=Pedobacter nanyangensis TaxID=1562389 RepID=UPI000DE3D36B|nr:ORF6N domain-containing protein [Pedobacter nanyangensis]